MAEMIDESGGLQSTTIGVYRTAATVKGGRRFSFGALVVVGNRNGQVGYGYGKANEVPQAIEKAQKYAKRDMVTMRRIGTTINHEVQGQFSSASVRLLPASPGTGVVAGGVVRSILEMAGVADCLTKCYGSTNARNVVKAVFDALGQLRTPDAVATLRGVTLSKTPIEEKIDASKAFMPKASSSEKAKGPVNTIGQDRKGGRGGQRGGGRGGRRGPAPAPDATPAEAPAPASDAPPAQA
ncbi:MAG: 30S ribosomal protein S5 [Phycisphaerales bacterium]